MYDESHTPRTFRSWSNLSREDIPVLDFTIQLMRSAVGESACRIDQHMVYMPVVNTHNYGKFDGEKPYGYDWPKGSYGFLPAEMGLWTYSKSEQDSALVLIPKDRMNRVLGELADFQHSHLRQLVAERDPVMTHSILALQSLARDEDPSHWTLLVDSISTVMITRVGARLLGRQLSLESRSGTLCTGRMARVKAYIEDNLHRTIGLAEMADVAALSQFHFLRVFKRSTGMTPRAYVWSRRVERAKKLLAQRSEPIAHVGFMCGFSSQSHFTKVFKSQTGVTPGAYKQSVI